MVNNRFLTAIRLRAGILCICVLPLSTYSETLFRLAAGLNQPIISYQDNIGSSVSNNFFIRPEFYGAVETKIIGFLYGEIGLGHRNLGGKINFVNSYGQNWREYYQYRYVYLATNLSLANFKFGFGEGVFIGYEFSYLTDAFSQGRRTNGFGEFPIKSIYDNVVKYNNGVDFGINIPLFQKLLLKLKYAYEFNNVTEIKSTTYSFNSNVSCFSALISLPIRFYLL